ncbi:hypothetical protein VUR80DRAFT_2445 [Thermomyces stellatus]
MAHAGILDSGRHRPISTFRLTDVAAFRSAACPQMEIKETRLRYGRGAPRAVSKGWSEGSLSRTPATSKQSCWKTWNVLACGRLEALCDVERPRGDEGSRDRPRSGLFFGDEPRSLPFGHGILILRRQLTLPSSLRARPHSSFSAGEHPVPQQPEAPVRRRPPTTPSRVTPSCTSHPAHQLHPTDYRWLILRVCRGSGSFHGGKKFSQCDVSCRGAHFTPADRRIAIPARQRPKNGRHATGEMSLARRPPNNSILHARCVCPPNSALVNTVVTILDRAEGSFDTGGGSYRPRLLSRMVEPA